MSIKKIILVVVIIGIIAAGIYAWKEFNRRNPDITHLKPEYIIEATELIKEYAADDSAANQKYLGKIIMVKGMVKTIEKDTEGYYTIVLGDTAKTSSVRCSMDTVHISDAANLKSISSVKLKGFVTGYNEDDMGLGSDVKMNRCVISKEKY